MSFPTNTSPYGNGSTQIPTSAKSNTFKDYGSKFLSGASSFLFGDPSRTEQRSTLGPEQQGLYQQLQNAGMARNAGGAFGQSADYYRDLLGNNSQDMESFTAPEMRRFNEQIVPDLAEQFAGMGSGGLSSSGFRNAAVGAGADLSERLGAIRANLRQRGAEGLSNIGKQGLGQYNENIYHPGTEGFLSQVAPAIGALAGIKFGPGFTSALEAGNSVWKGKSTGVGTGGVVGQGRAGMYPTQGNYDPYND